MKYTFAKNVLKLYENKQLSMVELSLIFGKYLLQEM